MSHLKTFFDKALHAAGDDWKNQVRETLPLIDGAIHDIGNRLYRTEFNTDAQADAARQTYESLKAFGEAVARHYADTTKTDDVCKTLLASDMAAFEESLISLSAVVISEEEYRRINRESFAAPVPAAS